jgi:hypothetical protein
MFKYVKEEDSERESPLDKLRSRSKRKKKEKEEEEKKKEEEKKMRIKKGGRKNIKKQLKFLSI